MDSDIVRRPPFGSNPLVGERGSDTRQRVLDAAMQVFAETAYPEARVEQITEKAGCSRPAFYQYFSSKEEVFWTLATQLAGEMVHLADRLGPVTPDEEGLATLTDWMGEFMALYEAWTPVFWAYPARSRPRPRSAPRCACSRPPDARRPQRTVVWPGASSVC
jgi:AcrR family transcriptional regulator